MAVMDSTFKDRVSHVVSQIPKGRVMTYGQIAAICGNPRAARIVGGLAHFGDVNLPWHRVVHKNGGLASGYPGGRGAHKLILLQENIKVDDKYRVSIEELLWKP